MIRFPRFTPAQLSFLSSLRAGARPTSACQDALTVGQLIRLKLVSWNEKRAGGHGFRPMTGTFSLTSLGLRLLLQHEAGSLPSQPEQAKS